MSFSDNECDDEMCSKCKAVDDLNQCYKCDVYLCCDCDEMNTNDEDGHTRCRECDAVCKECDAIDNLTHCDDCDEYYCNGCTSFAVPTQNGEVYCSACCFNQNCDYCTNCDECGMGGCSKCGEEKYRLIDVRDEEGNWLNCYCKLCYEILKKTQE